MKWNTEKTSMNKKSIMIFNFHFKYKNLIKFSPFASFYDFKWKHFMHKQHTRSQLYTMHIKAYTQDNSNGIRSIRKGEDLLEAIRIALKWTGTIQTREKERRQRRWMKALRFTKRKRNLNANANDNARISVKKNCTYFMWAWGEKWE